MLPGNIPDSNVLVTKVSCVPAESSDAYRTWNGPIAVEIAFGPLSPYVALNIFKFICLPSGILCGISVVRVRVVSEITALDNLNIPPFANSMYFKLGPLFTEEVANKGPEIEEGFDKQNTYLTLASTDALLVNPVICVESSAFANDVASRIVFPEIRDI